MKENNQIEEYNRLMTEHMKLKRHNQLLENLIEQHLIVAFLVVLLIASMIAEKFDYSFLSVFIAGFLLFLYSMYVIHIEQKIKHGLD